MKTLILTSGLLTLCFCAGAQSPTATLCVSDVDIQANLGDAPVFAYRYGNVPKKPYVQAWHTPRGSNILRDAPHDHLHHHGLMLAIKVEDVNFWEESAQGGVQSHQQFSDIRIAEGHAGFTERLFWHAADAAEPLLVENRTIMHSVLSGSDVRVLDWRSELSAPEGRASVTLSGSSYHGLGMRFPEYVDKVGTFLFSADATGAFDEGPHHLEQASWCAYTVQADGKSATIAMFSDPDNPRPTLWFTMREPFSYLSGTQDLSRQPMTLATGAPIVLRYGVAVWDTVVGSDVIETLCALWRGTLK